MLPEQVCVLVTTACSCQMPLAAGMLVSGRLCLFILPFKWEPVLGAPPDPALDGKFFAFDGELIYNQGSLVGIPKTTFHKTTNQVLVSTIHVLKAALAGDTDPMVPLLQAMLTLMQSLLTRLSLSHFNMFAFFSPSLMVLPPVSTSISFQLKLRLTVDIRCAYP